MTAMFTGWSLALLLGMRHAIEPDHLAAMSTLVAERRIGARRAAVLGALWGLGHAVTLLLVCGAMLALRARLPRWLGECFEAAVAVMLLALGARSIRQAVRAGREGPRHGHEHGPRRHAHAGPAGHVHLGGVTLAGRPLVIGVLHGLAGSGTLTAMVLASKPSTGAAIVGMMGFAIGAMAGMVVLTGAAGWEMGRVEGRGARWYAAVVGAAGVASVAMGGVVGWGVVQRVVG